MENMIKEIDKLFSLIAKNFGPGKGEPLFGWEDRYVDNVTKISEIRRNLSEARYFDAKTNSRPIHTPGCDKCAHYDLDVWKSGCALTPGGGHFDHVALVAAGMAQCDTFKEK